jgi:hypothetical protein
MCAMPVTAEFLLIAFGEPELKQSCFVGNTLTELADFPYKKMRSILLYLSGLNVKQYVREEACLGQSAERATYALPERGLYLFFESTGDDRLRHQRLFRQWRLSGGQKPVRHPGQLRPRRQLQRQDATLSRHVAQDTQTWRCF